MKYKPQDSGEIVGARDEEGKFVSGHAKLGGRKIGSISLTTKLKQELDELPDGQKETYADLLVKRIIDMALAGDVATIRMIWSYVDGLPKASLQIGSSQGRPIPILSGIHFNPPVEIEKEPSESDTQ